MFVFLKSNAIVDCLLSIGHPNYFILRLHYDEDMFVSKTKDDAGPRDFINCH